MKAIVLEEYRPKEKQYEPVTQEQIDEAEAITVLRREFFARRDRGSDDWHAEKHAVAALQREYQDRWGEPLSAITFR